MKSFWWSLILGTIVGNAMVQHFVLERDWFNAVGFGLTASAVLVVFIGLYKLYENWRSKQ